MEQAIRTRYPPGPRRRRPREGKLVSLVIRIARTANGISTACIIRVARTQRAEDRSRIARHCQEQQDYRTNRFFLHIFKILYLKNLLAIDYPKSSVWGQILAPFRTDHINLQHGGPWPLTLPVQAKSEHQSVRFGQTTGLVARIGGDTAHAPCSAQSAERQLSTTPPPFPAALPHSNSVPYRKTLPAFAQEPWIRNTQ